MLGFNISQTNGRLSRPVTAETRWSSARHLEVALTGKRLKGTAVNTSGTPSPTDTSVSGETSEKHSRCVKNVAFIKWRKITLQAREKERFHICTAAVLTKRKQQ